MPTASDVSRLLKLNLEMADFSEFVPHIRNGFPRQCFDDFLSETTIATAVMKLAAFKDMADATTLLTPAASDCLLRIARVYAETLELLSDENDVAQWMTTQSYTLGDQSPLDLLDTTIGFEIVFNEVKRIQYGIAG